MLLWLNENKGLNLFIVPNLYNMFIRVKKVKKRNGKVYEYAHLVSGTWKRRRLKELEGKRFFKKFNNSIHNYKKFVGRVYRFDNLKEKDFDEFLGESFGEFVKDRNVEEIYRKLIEYELMCCGFRRKKGIYVNKNVFVDLNRLVVHDGKSDVVVKLKDFSGYLCSLNLDELFRIQKISGRYEGVYFLKKLRMTGIELNAEQVYVLVEKMLKL